MMTESGEDLDFDVFVDDLRGWFGSPLRDVMRSLHLPHPPLVVVLPTEDANRLANEYQRYNPELERSGEGIYSSDPVRILQTPMEPGDFREQIAEFAPVTVMARLDVAVPDLPLTMASLLEHQQTSALQVVAICESMSSDACAHISVPEWFLSATVCSVARARLLELGAVTHVVECFGSWLIEFVRRVVTRPTPTYITRVPSDWQDYEGFDEIYLDGAIWKWGFSVVLPAGESWDPEGLAPGKRERIDQLGRAQVVPQEVDQEIVAYQLFRFIELALIDLIKNELGERPEEWWQHVPSDIRKQAASREGEGDAPLKNRDAFFELTDLVAIIRHHWARFQPLFDPMGTTSKKNALKGAQVVRNIRNRLMHPVRMIYQPLASPDLETLRAFKADLMEARERQRTE